MEITVGMVDGVHLTVSNNSGLTASVDGTPEIGGKDKGLRPMELFLGAMASCMSMDVLHIIRKSRIEPAAYKVVVQGTRREAVPRVFTDIKLTFCFRGDIPENIKERAVKLSVEKYCSVRLMLKEEIKITYEISEF